MEADNLKDSLHKPTFHEGLQAVGLELQLCSLACSNKGAKYLLKGFAGTTSFRQVVGDQGRLALVNSC